MNCSLDVSFNKIDEHGINETSQIVLYLKDYLFVSIQNYLKSMYVNSVIIQ